MINNFIKVALRIFLRQKFYTFINIIGLATGLASSIFIALWIYDEVAKNKFHKDIDRIYQVITNVDQNGQLASWPITPGPLAEEIRASIPDVSIAARLADGGQALIQLNDKVFLEHGYFADPDFFRVMSFPVVDGDAVNPLPNKNAIVISDRLAKKLFGNESAVGKVVKFNKRHEQKITAVIDDRAGESSITFDFLMPLDIYKEYRQPSWDNVDYDLYLKLNPTAEAHETMHKINEQVNRVLGQLDKDYTEGEIAFYLQPFEDSYLQSTFENGVPVGGRISYVRIFSVIAVFILIIACINFTNMATARATNRGKEVGVRKVAGAVRFGLIFQFVSEAVLISFLAMVVAMGTVHMLLPMFNILVSKQIHVPYENPFFVIAVIAVVILTGILAGSYPAFFLSAFKPARVLKGNTTASFSGSALRQILVVFQFSLTVILIAGAMVVYAQIQFIQNKNLGYNRSAILYFDGRSLNRDFESFKTEALKNPSIKTISRSDQVLVQVNNQNSSVKWPGKDENTRVLFRTVTVDYDFIETMGLKIVEGRSFSKEYTDTASFILSQTAVDIMGLNDPIGTSITQWGRPGKVVGVIEDFHSRSMHEAIDPIVLMCSGNYTNTVHVAYDPNNTQAVIKTVETLYKRANPGFPFDFTFIDERFHKLYQTERVTASLALGFTMVAIIISGLGMLGLAAYTAEKKRKEIPIRKTLGASVAGIVSSMSMDFIKLSLIATLIGCPIAYYLMDKFLSLYVYHTPLHWTIFLYTSLAIFIVTLTTVLFQVTKAALTSPVEALRSE